MGVKRHGIARGRGEWGALSGQSIRQVAFRMLLSEFSTIGHHGMSRSGLAAQIRFAVLSTVAV